MAAHPLDRALASDLSLQVLQRRQGRGELIAPDLDETNRRRQSSGLLPRGTEIVGGSRDSEESGLRHENQ